MKPIKEMSIAELQGECSKWISDLEVDTWNTPKYDIPELFQELSNRLTACNTQLQELLSKQPTS